MLGGLAIDWAKPYQVADVLVVSGGCLWILSIFVDVSARARRSGPASSLPFDFTSRQMLASSFLGGVRSEARAPALPWIFRSLGSIPLMA